MIRGPEAPGSPLPRVGSFPWDRRKMKVCEL